HLKAYIKLAIRAEERVTIARRDDALLRQKLFLDKGKALVTCGLYREAITEFEKALQQKANSPYTPVLLTEISQAYNHLGEYDRAFQELEKCSAYMLLMEDRTRESA
ncbi:MAG: hypothetical protein ACXVPK_10455, partial [Tumebacillaceae bacterium]